MDALSDAGMCLYPQVGDIVTLNSKANRYRITTEGAVCKILYIDNCDCQVRVLNRTNAKNINNEIYGPVKDSEWRNQDFSIIKECCLRIKSACGNSLSLDEL